MPYAAHANHAINVLVARFAMRLRVFAGDNDGPVCVMRGAKVAKRCGLEGDRGLFDYEIADVAGDRATSTVEAETHLAPSSSSLTRPSRAPPCRFATVTIADLIACLSSSAISLSSASNSATTARAVSGT